MSALDRGRRRCLGVAASVAVVWGVGGCASAPEVPAMQPAVRAPAAGLVARTPWPGVVAVRVTGGSATTTLDGPNIADADFKAAIEATLAQVRAFERVGTEAEASHVLGAQIVRLAKPLFGFSFTVELEVGWTLIDVRSGQVLWRRAVTQSGTATVSDALVGATRIRLAVEAAARANIEQMLRDMPGPA